MKKYFWNVIFVKNYGEQVKGDFDEWIRNFEYHEQEFYGTEDEVEKEAESICKENETYFLECIEEGE